MSPQDETAPRAASTSSSSSSGDAPDPPLAKTAPRLKPIRHVARRACEASVKSSLRYHRRRRMLGLKHLPLPPPRFLQPDATASSAFVSQASAPPPSLDKSLSSTAPIVNPLAAMSASALLLSGSSQTGLALPTYTAVAQPAPPVFVSAPQPLASTSAGVSQPLPTNLSSTSSHPPAPPFPRALPSFGTSASRLSLSAFSPASASPLSDSTHSAPSPRPPLPSLSLQECAEAKEAALANLANAFSPPRLVAKLAVEVDRREADPIDKGLVSEQEAERLVLFYHEEMNPYIILLDPYLNTLERVRRTSTILFTALLCVAAKFSNRAAYPALLDMAKSLISQQIGREISLGLIQAILLTVYWKDAEELHSWLRIGIAVRMGLQLHLHAERKTPLPDDELEARLILERERAWLVLIAFDHTYHLQLWENDDGFHETHMIPRYRVDLAHWVAESRHLGVRDDEEHVPNFEWIKVQRLSREVAQSRPAHARSLASHLEGVLEETYERFLNPKSPQCISPHTRSSKRVAFHLAAAHVSLCRGLLISTGTDGVCVSRFMVSAASMVEAFEDLAASGWMRFMQDLLAVMMFSLGEAVVKLFHRVGPSNQTLMLDWLQRVYTACETAAMGDSDSTSAFISRFYQLAIRVVCLPSGSATNTAGATPTALAGGAAIVPPPPPQPQPPAEAAVQAPPMLAPQSASSLPPSMPLFDSLDPSFSFADASYWDSLFPGQSTDWSWLDQPL
ncbi:hypothetical protein JCM8097_002033 [Rhodosporidiobolus ruineniae]